MYKLNGFEMRARICALDFDHTIAKPKRGATFSVNVKDWEWLRPEVPAIIKQYYTDGYCVMVFSED